LQSTSGENIAESTEETLPAAVDVGTQTGNTGKNVSVQFRSSGTAKGKLGFPSDA